MFLQCVIKGIARHFYPDHFFDTTRKVSAKLQHVHYILKYGPLFQVKIISLLPTHLHLLYLRMQ